MTDNHPRVFHLITRLLDGGAETVLERTVTGLEGYEITVGHGASHSPKKVWELENRGIQTKAFPLVRHYNPVTAIPAIGRIAWYMRREQFDIVHTHSTEAGIIGRVAAAVAGVPNVVHTIHGVPFTDDRNLLLNKFVQWCERSVASYTDQIVAVADVISETYLDRGIGIPEQYTTIYCGIPIKKFAEADPATDLPGERPRVLMVGRLASGKGFSVFLDAIEASNIGGSVLIAGDGPQREPLAEEIQKRGLEEEVSLLGFRDDIPQVMAASDVLVHPSFREGTPLVIFEAMASGLPVVATDVAGIPEQVVDGKSGFLVSPGDSDALANRLQELLSDSTMRERFGMVGQKRARRFSVENMISNTDSLYQELLSK